MHVKYDTINVQPQEQNADIYKNPSANDVEMTKGITNPMYTVQLRANENPYSFDTSTENTPTLCTADHDNEQ